MPSVPVFDAGQLEGICKVLGETERGSPNQRLASSCGQARSMISNRRVQNGSGCLRRCIIVSKKSGVAMVW